MSSDIISDLVQHGRNNARFQLFVINLAHIHVQFESDILRLDDIELFPKPITLESTLDSFSIKTDLSPGKYVVFSMSDTEQGISDDVIHKIFAPISLPRKKAKDRVVGVLLFMEL